MRRINRETRCVDHLTDVLSFPLLYPCRKVVCSCTPGSRRITTGLVRGWTKFLPLGDIVIAPDVARSSRPGSMGTAPNVKWLFWRSTGFYTCWDMIMIHPNARREAYDSLAWRKSCNRIGLNRQHDGFGPDELLTAHEETDHMNRFFIQIRIYQPGRSAQRRQIDVAEPAGRACIWPSHHPSPRQRGRPFALSIDEPDSQMIFLDTPGLPSSRNHRLDRYMLQRLSWLR